MTQAIAISPPRSLTHPPTFRPNPQLVRELGSGARLFAWHDKALLEHQERLVERARSASIEREEFIQSAGHLESFEILRAQLREGGLTRGEAETLRTEMKGLAAKVLALPHIKPEPLGDPDSQALGLVYDELRQAKISQQDATAELNWRSQRTYGAEVSKRQGSVYTDERPKLRAALAEPLAPRVIASPPKDTHVFYHPETFQLIRKGIELFPILDKNGDHVVDRNESRALLTDYQQLGLSDQHAATLYSRQADLAEALDPGPASHEKLTIPDLEALLGGSDGNISPEHAGRILELVSDRLAYQDRFVLSADLPVYGETAAPNPTRVKQGLEGNCWFLGVLPVLEPAALKSMLIPKGAEYEMHFADGSHEAVTPLNDAERRVYSHGDGQWSGLMEKALAQKLAKTGEDIKGGYTQEALKILTGAECQVGSLVDRPENDDVDYRDRANLAMLLEQTLTSGGAVFVQTSEDDYDPGISKISGVDHAYTVTGYDPVRQTVQLRNPWGRGEKADRDGIDDGNFNLSLTEMAANFSYVIAEKTV